MKKLTAWASRITTVKTNKLVTYDIRQEEIMRSFTYEEMVYLLLFGRRPSSVEAAMLRTVILSHCSHGITGQSTLAVRMAADCRSPFLNAALSGFLVGSGTLHQGSLELTMKELQAAHSFGDTKKYVEQKLADKQMIPGYGHRFHSHDPRARILMDLCKHNSFMGPYVILALEIDSILRKRKGIRMNIEAAGGAILLDMGFPPAIASLIILIGRGPMFAAAYMERLASDSKPFQKIKVFDITASPKRKKGGK